MGFEHGTVRKDVSPAVMPVAALLVATFAGIAGTVKSATPEPGFVMPGPVKPSFLIFGQFEAMIFLRKKYIPTSRLS